MAAKKAKRKTKKTVSKKPVDAVIDRVVKADEPVEAPVKVAKRETKPAKLSREQLERMAGGGATYNLSVHGMKPELKYFWSDEVRLHELELKGYTHVQKDEISGVGGGSARAGFKNISYGTGNNVVVTKRGVELFLMSCPKDTYDQIQAFKQGSIKEQEEAIYNRDGDDFYAVSNSKNNFH